MKVKINIEKQGKLEEREVLIKIKGRDQQIVIKKLNDFANSAQGDVDVNMLQESSEFLKYIDTFICERAENLTLDELNDLDIEEKNKIVTACASVLIPWGGNKGFF